MSDEYDYTIWQGDTDEIEIILSDDDGIIDLSTVDEITAIVEEYTGDPRYEIICTGNSNGVLTIPFSPDETEVSGSFNLCIQITTGNAVNTWPSDGPRHIKILKSL